MKAGNQLRLFPWQNCKHLLLQTLLLISVKLITFFGDFDIVSFYQRGRKQAMNFLDHSCSHWCIGKQYFEKHTSTVDVLYDALALVQGHCEFYRENRLMTLCFSWGPYCKHFCFHCNFGTRQNLKITSRLLVWRWCRLLTLVLWWASCSWRWIYISITSSRSSELALMCWTLKLGRRWS